MTYALVLREFGAAENMHWEAQEEPTPGPGELLLEQKAVGLNFIDVYQRKGAYPVPLPVVLGQEGAGRVLEVGAGVVGFSEGDRVAYAGLLGAYAEQRVVPANRVVRLPDDITEEIAAASLLKGMTAHMLLFRLRKIEAGQRILVHAAAGGVGQLLCQWGTAMGLEVHAIVSTEEKAETVKALGIQKVLISSDGHFSERIRSLCNGAGVDAVFDSVGKTTLGDSLKCLAKRGLLASFGQSSGRPPSIDISQLAAGGSLTLTRPSLFDYISSPEELEQAASAWWEILLSGKVKVDIGQSFALADGAEAHRRLESRQTTGSTVLRV